jgi:hypothetical protein
MADTDGDVPADVREWPASPYQGRRRMISRRRVWLSVLVLAAILAIGVTARIASEAHTATPAPERPLRLIANCAFQRSAIVHMREHLWSTSREDRQLGEDEFRREDGEWKGLADCPNALPVGGACAPRERPCMLWVADWALVNLR